MRKTVHVCKQVLVGVGRSMLTWVHLAMTGGTSPFKLPPCTISKDKP